MKKIHLLLIVIVALFTQCQKPASNFELNLEEGQKLKQIISVESKIDQEIMGQKFAMTMILKSQMSFVVEKASQEGYEMKVSYDNMGLEMDSPMGKMSFNSDNANENDFLSQMLSSLTGKAFKISIDRKGRISQVSDFDNIIESILSAYDQYLPGEQLEQLKDQLKKSFGEEALKANLEMATSIFPSKSVSKGDRWSVEISTYSGFPAKITTNYSLKEVSDDYYLIEGEGSIVSDSNTTEISGMNMSFLINGKIKSTLKVDPKTGWIIKADISQEIEGSSKVEPNAQVPQGMEIPMKVSSKISYTN
ncbi:MAG TPA: DUF6263 family protein [Salinivirgaceae bacterium]|nr:DUF6263 family protein [Salinivirgaceae bacterium]